MKDELRSESQAEIGRGGKIRKSPFFGPAHFSAILPPGLETWIPNQGLSQCVAVSRSDKYVIRAKEDFSSCDTIVQSRAFPGRILTTDGHGWILMGQRLLIRAHPCLSVVEFLGLRLVALGILRLFAAIPLRSVGHQVGQIRSNRCFCPNHPANVCN
jgi:hypothetical protein